MRASVFVWFSFAHFQLQPVPERLQHPGCYQFEQDVWSELSSADIWFFFPQTYIPVPLLVVRSKPEHLIMSAWGVKQTQCQENCATHVHNRALEGCFFISQIVVCTWNLPSGRSGEFPEIYLPDANEQKKKKEKETTKTNVAVHHFPSGCRIQPDQTWHNKHLYLQELYSSFLHLSVQISLSICLKTPVTTGTNMKICSLGLNLFFLSQ